MFNRCCISIVSFICIFLAHASVSAQYQGVECVSAFSVEGLYSTLSVESIGYIKSISSRLCIEVEMLSGGGDGITTFEVKSYDDSKVALYYTDKHVGGVFATLIIKPDVSKLCIDSNEVTSVFGNVHPIYRTVIADFRGGRDEAGFRPFTLLYTGFGDYKSKITFDFLFGHCANEVSIFQRLRGGE